MSKTKIKIRLDEKKRIKLLMKYIRSLNSTRFYAAVRTKFESEIEQRVLERQARLVIQELIYNVYSPKKYIRTYALIRGVRTAADRQGRVGGLVIYSDPTISPSKLNPSLSYITFFQKPVEFKSFIQPRGQRDITNYRPFVGRLQALMRRHSNQSARRAYREVMEEMMPRQLSAGI